MAQKNGTFAHGALRILRSTIIGVMDLSTERDDVYRGCALGKYVKAVFPISKNKTKSILGLIHSNIYRPMSTKALSGVDYFLTFIDDHSRKTWIYFLKTKDEVFYRFKEFKALVENMTKKKINFLRSDNGGEYVNKDFIDFCAKEGIKREWTYYNLEQNGVAERKNRTIVEATRAMMYDQDMPKFLWAEACNTTVYI